MTTAWTISAGVTRVELDGRRQGAVTFIVTNPGPVDDRAVLDVVASDGAQGSWFSVDEPQRTVPRGGSATFTVAVKPDEDTVGGEYWLAGRVYSADSAPEETAVLSDRVSFTVPVAAEPTKSRWWLWAIPAAVLVLAVAGVVTWLLLRDGEEPPPARPDQPQRPIVLLDIVENAAFSSGAGALPLPGSPGDDRGFAIVQEEGTQSVQDGSSPRHIRMHPQWVDDGYISGDFPLPNEIGAGDRFRAEVGFLARNIVGDVTFVVAVVDDRGNETQFHRQRVRAPGAGGSEALTELDVDLRLAAGLGTIRLTVEAGPSSGQDWAVWANPRIERADEE